MTFPGVWNNSSSPSWTEGTLSLGKWHRRNSPGFGCISESLEQKLSLSIWLALLTFATTSFRHYVKKPETQTLKSRHFFLFFRHFFKSKRFGRSSTWKYLSKFEKTRQKLRWKLEESALLGVPGCWKSVQKSLLPWGMFLTALERGQNSSVYNSLTWVEVVWVSLWVLRVYEAEVEHWPSHGEDGRVSLPPDAGQVWTLTQFYSVSFL